MNQVELAKKLLESKGYKVEKVNESTEKGFKVGDKISWSGLYGDRNTAVIKDISEDDVKLDISWVAEDTGEIVHKVDIYPLVKDSAGNTVIQVWEYEGHKGYVYPPNMNESKDVQYGVHQFSTGSIIFRGTHEECAEYIDKRKHLWDDAEVYEMTPDDPHYLKEDASEEDLVSKVKSALDDAGIKYTLKGRGDRLVVAKTDLEKASEIRDEIDPKYSVTVCSLA